MIDFRIRDRPPGSWRAAIRGCICCGLLVGLGRGASGIDIQGYTPAANDRFASGFPGAPIPNTGSAFVGLAYDWSGVGWDSTDPTQGFGFITPRHYLVARHVGGANAITLLGAAGTLVTGTQDSVTDTGYGYVLDGTGADLAVGRLAAPLPAVARIARYAMLDLNPTSTTAGSYVDAPLLVYGRGPLDLSSGPRIGADAVVGTTVSGSRSFIASSTPQIRLEVGDSGSPVFVPWTSPAGRAELTLVGNNAARSFVNFHNLAASPPALAAVDAVTVLDGFAARVVGDPAATWRGGPGGDLAVGGNWSTGTVPTDLYTVFDGTSTADRDVAVQADVDLRGLAFLPAGPAAAGFTFAGSTHVLTVGRGGITNAGAGRQVFVAPLALGADQYWDVGAGGVTVADVDTRGHLLEIAGSGTARIAGPVTGAGGLALSGHRLELDGVSPFTGNVWVHAGMLAVSGTLPAAGAVVVESGATVGGTGRVPTLSGGGTVAPGPDATAGILAATAIDAAAGPTFQFDFDQVGSPTWGAATASGNDVLRLTGTAPFAVPLPATSRVSVFLAAGPLASDSVLRGGFFTDRDVDFLPSISGATFSFFTLAADGPVLRGDRRYAPYAGPLGFSISTVAVTAAFSGGTESGFVMQIRAVPEPATAVLALAAAMTFLVLRRAGGPAGVRSRGFGPVR